MTEIQQFEREFNAIKSRTTTPVMYALSTVCLKSPARVKEIIAANKSEFDRLNALVLGNSVEDRAEAITALIDMVQTQKGLQ